MRLDWCWVVIVGVVLGLTSRATLGQNKIPYEIVTAESALTTGQQSRIDAYVEARLNQLLQGLPDQVSEAREQLIEPFGLVGASDIFTLAYSAAVSDRLIEALHSNKILVKLNAMIVAASLIDPGVVRLIEIGLTDDNPALRYWAGKAVGDIETSPATRAQRALSSENQRLLLAVIKEAIGDEPSHDVLHRLLLGIVTLEVSEAGEFLLDELNRRVSFYATDARLPIGPITRILRAMYINLVQASARGKQIFPEQRQKTTMVAYRYLVLCASALDRGTVDPAMETAYKEMVELTDSILTWMARSTFPEGTDRPESVKKEVQIENWPEILLRAGDWRLLLLKEFNFDQEDLTVAGVQ